MLLIFSAFAGLVGCVIIMIKRSQHHGFPYKQYNLSNQVVTTK
jgi:hypothetical protein